MYNIKVFFCNFNVQQKHSFYATSMRKFLPKGGKEPHYWAFLALLPVDQQLLGSAMQCAILIGIRNVQYSAWLCARTVQIVQKNEQFFPNFSFFSLQWNWVAFSFIKWFLEHHKGC